MTSLLELRLDLYREDGTLLSGLRRGGRAAGLRLDRLRGLFLSSHSYTPSTHDTHLPFLASISPNIERASLEYPHPGGALSLRPFTSLPNLVEAQFEIRGRAFWSEAHIVGQLFCPGSYSSRPPRVLLWVWFGPFLTWCQISWRRSLVCVDSICQVIWKWQRPSRCLLCFLSSNSSIFLQSPIYQDGTTQTYSRKKWLKTCSCIAVA